jgi:transcriptional regulator with XRE-family HTH domain
MPKGARRRPRRLAEKLNYIRHRLELTQQELAEQIERVGYVSDLDRTDISDFERGRRDPDLLTLLSYANLINVFLDVLVDDGLDLPENLPSQRKHVGIKHTESHDIKFGRTTTVTLKFEIKGSTKLVRSANRVRANIERYHLREYKMRKLKEGLYQLTIPYKNDTDLKRRIRLLLNNIENEAARDSCILIIEVNPLSGRSRKD